MNHQIRQQYIHVEFSGSESEGLDIQRIMSDLYYRNLLPAIEKAFDQSIPDDKVLKIDRLDIDVGTVNLNHIDQQIADLLSIEVLKAIRTEITTRNSSTPTSIQNVLEVKSIAENLADILIFFLKTGSLPWYFRPEGSKSLEDTLTEAMDGGLISRESGHFVNTINEALSFTQTIKRLTNQFTQPFQFRLLCLLSPEIGKITDRISAFIDHNSLSPEVKTVFRKTLFESAFTYASVPGNKTESGLITQFAGNLPVSFTSMVEIKEILNINKSVKVQISEGNQNGKSNLANLQIPSKEGFYIHNAGLVLLHPFLPDYFKALEIAKDNDMARPSRALSLLHYLVSGQTTAPEYELVLPRILCGFPLFMPVLSEEEINVNESEESQALLTAVILHWQALKNTGPEALRETFLKRPGKLIQENDDFWVLKVESATFDVLLDQLPWGIGLIRLPWMKQTLEVEWRS